MFGATTRATSRPAGTLDRERTPPCAGGRLIEEATGPWGEATAVFDDTGTYRYLLTRRWDAGGPVVNVVMLNPSTADAHRLDPTVRRCAGLAREWGFGALEVTNAYAFRATDPAALRTAADPVGPENDAAVAAAAARADLVVAAWGNAIVPERAAEVRTLLRGAGTEPAVLHLTRRGEPGHPLYLPRTTVPRPWPAADAPG